MDETGTINTSQNLQYVHTTPVLEMQEPRGDRENRRDREITNLEINLRKIQNGYLVYSNDFLTFSDNKDQIYVKSLKEFLSKVETIVAEKFKKEWLEEGESL